MNDFFRHLHMRPELACEFLAVVSRMEYALKATPSYATGGEHGVNANRDRFADDIDAAFGKVNDEAFRKAVDFILTKPPRKQVLKQGRLGLNRPFLMIRTVRNNLFHGGTHLPDGEREAGRNEELVSSALTIPRHCIPLNEHVRVRFEV
jgi:hypothetical protein